MSSQSPDCVGKDIDGSLHLLLPENPRSTSSDDVGCAPPICTSYSCLRLAYAQLLRTVDDKYSESRHVVLL